MRVTMRDMVSSGSTTCKRRGSGVPLPNHYLIVTWGEEKEG
jgi:hypothetical protein